MPQEFKVNYSVTMIVWAERPDEAQELGRGWLQDALNTATGAKGRYPRVWPTQGTQNEEVHPLWPEESKKQETSVRRTPGRLELLAQLRGAVTTEDYLAVRGTLREWLASHPEPYSTALSLLSHHLDTFAEAIRWAEQHPASPCVWNVGALLTRIKAEVQQEWEETKAVEPSEDVITAPAG